MASSCVSLSLPYRTSSYAAREALSLFCPELISLLKSQIQQVYYILCLLTYYR